MRLFAQSDLLEKHAMNTNMGDEVRRLRGANKARAEMGRGGKMIQDVIRCVSRCVSCHIMTLLDYPCIILYPCMFTTHAWERVGKARNIAFPAQGVPHPSIGTAPSELTYVGANHQRPTGPYASLVKSNHDINHGQVANRCKIRHPNP
jgi:hypothetical protein